MSKRSAPTRRTCNEEEYHAAWYYDNNEERGNSYLYQDVIYSKYDGYDDFNAHQCKLGTGGGGMKQRSKQKNQDEAQVNVYSSRHARIRNERKNGNNGAK